MKRPAFQFYPADWRKDASLQSCSLASRGLWHEMMCLMHECEPYGHLSINGKPMKPEQVARLVGISDKEYTKLLTELHEAGVPSISSDGCILSRRMVKDEHLRNVRAEAGKKGGNPNLLSPKVGLKVKQTVNPQDKQDPTPSSSSSSSTTETKTPPNPPEKGGEVSDESSAGKPKRERKDRCSLKTFLERCRAAGETAIRGYEPLRKYVDGVELPMEFVQLSWDVFKAEHSPGGANERRLQADWRKHFLGYVTKGYYRLWYADAQGNFALTTVGIQAQKLHARRDAE